MGHEREASHLLHYTEQQRKLTENRVFELYQQGLTIRAISAETGMAFTSVFRLIKKLEREGV